MFNINLMNLKYVFLSLVLAITIISLTEAQNLDRTFNNTSSYNNLVEETKKNTSRNILLVDCDTKSFPLLKECHKQKEFVEETIESFPCINWCRYTDKNLDECWKHSLKHHAVELLHKVNDLYSALLHMDHWRRSNTDNPEEDGYMFEAKIIDEVLGMRKIGNRSEVNDTRDDVERSKIDKTVLRDIFDVVFKEFLFKKELFHSKVPSLPSLACPIPCDYYPKMWMTLTAIVSMTLMLVILVVMVYLFCDSWSPRRRGKWRLV